MRLSLRDPLVHLKDALLWQVKLEVLTESYELTLIDTLFLTELVEVNSIFNVLSCIKLEDLFQCLLLHFFL